MANWVVLQLVLVLLTLGSLSLACPCDGNVNTTCPFGRWRDNSFNPNTYKTNSWNNGAGMRRGCGCMNMMKPGYGMRGGGGCCGRCMNMMPQGCGMRRGFGAEIVLQRFPGNSKL